MTTPSRRAFLTSTAVLAAGTLIERGAFAAPAKPAAPPVVNLSWLGDQAPLVPASVAWGVPWPRGTVAKKAQVALRDGAGNAIAAQTWPMAYWPDGSIKWTGFAIAADASTKGLTVSVGNAKPVAPKTPVSVSDAADAVTITTGPLTAKISKSGSSLITSLTSDGREVARNGRLIALREDRSQFEAQGVLREVSYTSNITKVTVEQSGPVRAVVKIEGTHSGDNRQWLPFVVRFYFTAGLNSVRMVHSFVFDGDQAVDFIKGIGLAFSVPFREETQNRHIRFATDGDNIFAEPVVLSPGFRSVNKQADYERAQLIGQRVPNLAEMSAQEKAGFAGSAIWDSFKIRQLNADGWELFKRTNAKSSWLHITSGNRARGLAYLGDVSGGLAIGVKRFWQKYPAGFEISNAATPAGELKVWFWSPDAEAMDMRHYDTVGHPQSVTYEDYQDGHSNAFGCANTSELTLWATPDTPSAEAFDAMTKTGNAPPLLICPPQHYYDCHALGIWSLPGTPAPGLSAAEVASAETQLDRAFTFYNGEIERRRWYGFWDFGDYRRTYDPIRHQWMYDIGGHGWDATELMPNVWLWFAFLRSGRADLFRAAEDMTRNTNEVDVFHMGPFAGVGSRHNVSHWGDGAKEARINEAFIKRFYYYLTTDERTGDLMREPIDQVEKTLASIPPLREVQPRPDIKAPQAFIRIGPDWLALASNWMAEWERTGDPKYRDWCLTGMKDIGAKPDVFLVRDAYLFDPVTKHLTDVGNPNQRPSQFLYLFAGDQIAAELLSLIDCPEFATAWYGLCEQFARAKTGNWYFQTRVTAYAANYTGDQALEDYALTQYKDLLKFKDGDYFIATPNSFDGATVMQPAKENPSSSTFAPAIATPEVSQWAINLISAPELFRTFKARPQVAKPAATPAPAAAAKK
jgi:hypothetical protein